MSLHAKTLMRDMISGLKKQSEHLEEFEKNKNWKAIKTTLEKTNKWLTEDIKNLKILLNENP